MPQPLQMTWMGSCPALRPYAGGPRPARPLLGSHDHPHPAAAGTGILSMLHRASLCYPGRTSLRGTSIDTLYRRRLYSPFLRSEQPPTVTRVMGKWSAM